MTEHIIDKVREQISSLNSFGLEGLSAYDTRETFISMIGAIAKAIELRDEYTSYHQQNVAVLSEALGVKLGMPPLALLGLRLGATVHDVGKIAVPAEVLNKTGKLNAADIAMMQLHPSFGGKILRDVKSPWPLAEMVEQHHERLDGTGYPKHLRGDEIIIEARIIAVADTFDAMASERPYRKALGVEAAITELKNGTGTKYDASAVEALIELVDSDTFKELPLFGYS